MKLILVLVFATVVASAMAMTLDHDITIVKPLSSQMYHYINVKMNATWRAGPTKFNQWSMASIKRLMGVPIWHMGEVTRHLDVVEHKFGDLPENFDSREQWPDCPTIKEIRDQGNCGSCWAISAVEAMSDRVCVASKTQVQTHLSTEDMVSCCHTCGFGCNGGFPQMAWEYFKRTGICTGGNYQSNQGCKPYSIAECEHHVNGTRPPCQGESHTPKCKNTCINSDYNVPYTKDKAFGSTVYTVKTDEAQIQQEIMTNGPVQTAFTVYEDFLSYTSGIYEHKTGASVGGHAVKIIGWGVENDVPYWLIANSWNTDWAENGLFRIVRGKNHCGIEESVVAGAPKLI